MGINGLLKVMDDWEGLEVQGGHGHLLKTHYGLRGWISGEFVFCRYDIFGERQRTVMIRDTNSTGFPNVG